jgi:hypothetical protein
MMKKLLYLFLAMPLIGLAQTNVYNYGFSTPTATMTTTDGWTRTNQSTSPSATSLWTVASYTPVVVNSTAVPAVRNLPFGDLELPDGSTCPAPNGQAGGANSFALVNYTSTTSTLATGATISNWLISPIVTVQNGDVVSFYSRLGKIPGSAGNPYPDRLQLRMSTDGAFSTDPAGGPTNVGSYTVVLNDVNPTLTTTGYPQVWTLYTATISGLTSSTDVKFAFRYFVTNGGTNGSNSDIIGIDTFDITRPTANTQDFFAGNFTMQPNPVTDVFNITAKNGVSIETIQVLDINGRVVNQVNASNSEAIQVNVSNLNAGVYFVKVQSDLGVGTSKIIKK